MGIIALLVSGDSLTGVYIAVGTLLECILLLTGVASAVRQWVCDVHHVCVCVNPKMP